ncbi:transcriptional regulator/antitoxin, MazE [Thermoproteus uzoniensis 768-20]|uniref:Transcriptional regulator/antitoxin, MazE n=1 Tax=Thermoproteus uzoniensis (strain 768-20) TaxID=999630 RepID=F2L0Z8_THEU7|nr:AbrB/MazE/SpoVT family DNA-binding domain-containing protein [Thermoproteus uzoniensis]AEA11547.1 transcriptional regulator/antitoxin, MazE [Thermoproteus uzoniensis 768-20]
MVSKKNTVYIPKEIADALGIGEGSLLELRVEGGTLVAVPISSPLRLALEGSKFAKTTVDEFEREGEEKQGWRGYFSTPRLSCPYWGRDGGAAPALKRLNPLSRRGEVKLYCSDCRLCGRSQRPISILRE